MIYNIKDMLGTLSIRFADSYDYKEWQEPMGYIMADISDTTVLNTLKEFTADVASLLQTNGTAGDSIMVNYSKSTVGYGLTVDELLDGDPAGTIGFPENTVWKIIITDVDGNGNKFNETPGYLHGELTDEGLNKLDAMNRALVGLTTNTYQQCMLGAGFTLE